MVTLHKSDDRKMTLPKQADAALDSALYAKCLADGWRDLEAEKAKAEAEEAAELEALEAEEEAAKDNED